MSGSGQARIAELTLDQRSIVRWSPTIEHERNVAIFDILEANEFAVAELEGPYSVALSLRESNIVLTVTGALSTIEIVLATRPLRHIVKDYFLICESYLQAIRGATPSRIEALDMARRGLHNEGAELLREGLRERVEVDFDTARRLFTLVCVLHIRG